MIKAILFSTCIFLVTIVFAQYELNEIQYSKAGSPELIIKAVPPLDDSKGITYDSLNMTYAGGWSFGQSFCIASHTTPVNKWIFVGAGAGVMIFDATDPYNLIKLSEIHARALVDDIHYGPGFLYLSAYFSGLEIWDIDDIENPQRLSRTGTTGLPRGGIYAPPLQTIPGEIPFVFLVNVVDGVDVFSVDWDGQPEFITNQNLTGSALIWDSFGFEWTLFIPAGNGGTKVIDLDDFWLGTYYTIPGYATSVASSNNYMLYILDHNFGLKVQNLPAMPYGQIALDGFPYRLYTTDSLAVIANSTTNPGGGINIVDITDWENPELMGEYPGYQTFVTGRSDASFSTGSSDGLVALDITDPTTPLFASNVELPVSANDIAVRDDYAYMGNNGFRVFDVSDKSHPVQVGYNETDGALVKLHGNYAVLCPKSMGSSNRINIMDVSDPENPEKLAHVTAPYMTYDLDIKGTYAYVACWWDGIRVVNFSDPEAPAWGSHVMGWVNGATPGEEWLYCQALDVSGDYLFAVDYGPFPDEDTRGLYVFDISDPATPVLLKRFPDYQGTAYDIEVSNGYAYIADADGGLSIVSVQDPLAPIQASYLALPDVAWAVDIFGNHAFVANYINGGVQVVDISLPEMPVVEGYYKRSGCFALNVTYHAGHAFVADGPAGMQIYNFDLLDHAQDHRVSGSYMTVFPNPATNTLTIRGIERHGPAQLTLFDISGKSILDLPVPYNGVQSQARINVSELPRGIYLLKVTNGKTEEYRKIILQ